MISVIYLIIICHFNIIIFPLKILDSIKFILSYFFISFIVIFVNYIFQIVLFFILRSEDILIMLIMFVILVISSHFIEIFIIFFLSNFSLSIYFHKLLIIQGGLIFYSSFVISLLLSPLDICDSFLSQKLFVVS